MNGISRSRRLRPLMAVLIACVANVSIAADVRITPMENWSTAFAGGEVKVGMRVVSDRTPQGTLRWAHSANQRTLARGEVEVRRSGDVSATAEFVLRPPALREGVVLATTVTTEYVPRGGNKAVASETRTVWLFPRDPLAGRTEWAKALDIELFDPAGITSKVFDDLKLPYRSVNNAGALNDPEQQGVLIIGEGASLLRTRSLARNALEAAASGRRVVLLAPENGSLTVPGTDGDDLDDDSIPSELRFARNHIITELDKRLDAEAWPGTNNAIPSSRFLVESHRGRVDATMSDKSRAWPWLEIRFPKSDGVLVICGFRVIKHHDNGPTPRFLLVRLLESLSPAKTEN